MRIGTSSPSFCAIPMEDVLTQLSRFFKHWEIISEGEHHLPTIAPRLSLMKDSYDMTYSIHAPISDVNIASLNNRIRESSVLEIIELMELAVSMNIKTITYHPGLYSLSVPDMENVSIANAKKSIKTLDRIATSYGINLALENMPSFPFMLAKTADEMLELVDGTDMKICFDIGHANTTKQIDEFIEKLGDRFVNIHIHDNDGVSDLHQTLGKGNIDFKSVLQKLNRYGGRYIIESKGLESSVDSLDILNSFFL